MRESSRGTDRLRRMTEWAALGAAIGTPLAATAGAAFGALLGLVAAAVADRRRRPSREG